MASFVESATLALVDKTTANVNKINKSLDNLFRRVKKLQTLADKDIELKFKTSSINSAVRTLDRAQKKFQDFGKTTIEPKIRVNTTDAINKLADIRRTANMSARTSLRIDINQAMQQISKVRRQARTAVNMPLNANIATQAANNFSNAVQGRATNWGRVFAASVGAELWQQTKRIATAAARTSGEGIMSLSDANLALEMAVGNRPNADNLMKTVRDLALELSTGEFKGVSQAGLIDLGAESISNLENIDPASIRGMMELSARNAAMLAALEKNTDAGNEQARILNKINAQLNVASDPAKAQLYDDAILAQRAASGQDFTMQQIQNMLQQVPPALRKVMTPEAVARLGNIREEGGRQSTADVRQAFNDLLRGNLAKYDKAAMAAFGLRNRDGTANSAIVEEAGRDPVEFALRRMLPRLKAAGVDLDDYGAMQSYFDNVAGFSPTGSKFWADIIGSRDQIAIGDRSRRGADPTAALDRDASLRQSMNRFEQQLQNVAARATESIVPIANEAMQSMTDVFARQAKGEQLSPLDWAAIAGGGLALGTGVALSGLADPQTRPLAAAGLALTSSAGALTAAAVALGAAAGTSIFGKLPGGKLPGGKLGAALLMGGGAWGIGNLIAEAEQIDPKTKEKVGIKGALAELVAEAVVAGRDNKAWSDYDATKKINELPFNQLPPMNRAEARESGLYDALTGGATQVAQAGESAATAIGTGASALSEGIVSGAQTAASIIANAIASAAANIRVSATAQAVAATPALDTGHTTFGPR